MKKKVLIISLILLGVIGLGIGSFFLVKELNSKTDGEVKEKEVASIVILDINPSIKVSLDKDNKVIKMEALNNDAKDIVYSDCEGNELDYVIYKIVNNLVDKGYTEEKITMLVSTDGEIKTDEVERLLKNEFTTKNIENEILVLEDTSDSAKAKAEEYGISESKASFIEGILEEKSQLSFDELKDKSIEELNEIKNQKEEVKEDVKEEKKEEIKSNTNTNSNTSTNTSTNTTENPSTNTTTQSSEKYFTSSNYTCTPPSDLKSTEWCNWNVKRPQNCSFNYPQKMDLSGNDQTLYSTLGVNTNDIKQSYTVPSVHSGASYCESYIKRILTSDTFYTVEFDSVTGEIYSSKKEVVSTKYTEEQVKKMGMDYWKMTEEDLDMIWVVLGINGDSSNIFFTYQVNMRTKDNMNYSVDYNADTGAILSYRSW